MIPRRDELTRSIGAAWRLFLGDPRGMAGFDLSVEGFWRSFGAIFPILPFYLCVVLVERQIRFGDAATPPDVSEGHFFFVRALIVAVDWVALPVLLGLFARPLGIAQNYAAFVIARNWASVLVVVPDTFVTLLLGLGVVSREIAAFLSLAALLVILRYRYFVARIALGVGIGFAIAITIADLLLSLVINVGLDQLLLGWDSAQ
jgi:hypothetical protein